LIALLLANDSFVLAADNVIALENEHFLIEFSPTDGSVTRLRNKDAGLDLIASRPKTPRAWALLLSPLRLVSDFTVCRVTPDTESPHRRVSFEWQTPYKITVTAEARLDADSDQLRFFSAAKNDGDQAIVALRYPDIQGIGSLSETGESDRLLHSASMGLVFNDPFHLFQSDHPIPQGRGMVNSRYPNGFHGSATQLMAYYVEGRGGFSFVTEDGHSTDKEFNFFKSPEASLSCEIVHFNWDARPGKSLEVDYPIVISSMTEGTWYEAASRYRDWAIQQPWCRRGTMRERVAKGEASKWLLEEIGAVGVWWPFRDDIRAAIARTRELFGAPLLHLELWWRNKESLAAAHADGDRFGPFYFPHLGLKETDTFNRFGGAQVVPTTGSISPRWAVMCAASPNWRRVFLETAEDLTGYAELRHRQIWIDENRTGCDADCLYYDIGPCAGIPTHCYSADHGHAPGAGRAITDAHATLIAESRERASARKGFYVPVGTECASEPFVGCLDFYYPRNAGFNLEMELVPYIRQLTWLPDGNMEAVPLFAFIYHQHGPVAIQGIHSVIPWGLTEADDLFTWAEARAYLWGGVMTAFPVPADAKASGERTRFLRSLTAARTGFARDYLAYGRMQPPPTIACEPIKLDHGLAEGGWLRKLRFADKKTAAQSVGFATEPPRRDDDPEPGEKPDLSVEEWVGAVLAAGATPASKSSIQVPSVLNAAYTLDNTRLGLVLVNLKSDAEQTIRLTVDPTAFGLKEGEYELRRCDGISTTALGRFAGQRELDVRLPSREVVLVEAVLATSDNGDGL
jgi:hypothetical protein